MSDASPRLGSRPGREEAVVGLLAFGAGAMDALSFMALGQVFTSAMTGNAVLLGIAVGEGRMAAAARSVAALAGFLAGAALASPPLAGWPRGTFSRGVIAGFAIEAGILLLFALLLAILGAAGDTRAIILILFAAAGMGAQSVVVRHLDMPGIITTVFTGTLVDIVYTLMGVTAPPRAPRRISWRTAREIASFVVYTAGAAAGGGLTLLGAGIAGFVPLAAVLASLAMLR